MRAELTLVRLIRWIATVVSLCVVVVLGSGCASRLLPRAADGVFDLAAWDFGRDGPVSLDGEWEFYWQELLTPEDFAGQRVRPSGFIAVPGAWNGWSAGDMPLPAEGYATYRLRLKLPANDGVMALLVPSMRSAYRLWVDDTLVAANGVVGTTFEATAPRYGSTIAYVAPRSDAIQIVVQVANFNFRDGGVWGRFTLGSAPRILDDQVRELVLRTAVLGGILTMAFYHLMLYLLRRGDRSALLFGLCCFVIALRIPFTSNQMLLGLLPAMSGEVHLKLEYLTGYVALPAFLLFLASIYPRETSPRVVRLAQLISGVLGAVGLLAPARLSSELIPPYGVLVMLFVAYSAIVLVRAARRGREGARAFLIGGGAFCGALIHDLLTYIGIIHSTEWLPSGLFVLILMQAWVLAARFAQAFRGQVALATENARLLDELRRHLDDLRQSRRLLAAREEQRKKDIAEFLHGRVQTRLVIVSSWLGDLPSLWQRDPKEAQALLTQARVELDRLRDTDIRQASHLLHPTIIGVGLVPAARALVAGFKDQFRVRLEVEPRLVALDGPAQRGLPETVRLTAYRILEEALNNVSVHAKATRVDVLLGLDEARQLTLCVQDDGVGLPQSQVELGLGLGSIAARVGELGGHWKLSDAPGKGTALSAWLPLDDEGRAALGERTSEAVVSGGHAVERAASPLRRWTALASAAAAPSAKGREA